MSDRAGIRSVIFQCCGPNGTANIATRCGRFWKGENSLASDLATRAWQAAAICTRQMVATPYASINFITAHDGFSMQDLVSYDGKHNDANGEGNRDGTDDNCSWNCGAEGDTQDAKHPCLT